MAALTPKQKTFARCVGSGMTLADSYREAYSAKRMKSASIRVEASRLMSNPNVTLLAERIQKEAERAVVASTVSDKDLVLNSLRHHVKEADTDGNKIRATEILGKTVPGLFKGEEPAEVERTADEIREELSRHLADIASPDPELH